MSTSDWMNQSGDDFLRMYAPHAVAPKSTAVTPTVTRQPATPAPFMEPVAMIPNNSNNQHRQDQHDMSNDNANERREILRAMMMMDSDQMIEYEGKRVPVSTAIHDMLNGGGKHTSVLQPPQTAQQKQQQANSAGVIPSHAAIDSLSEADYAELQATGGIEGVTYPLRPRVTVKYAQTIERRVSFNDEGKIIDMGAPRPIDITSSKFTGR